MSAIRVIVLTVAAAVLVVLTLLVASAVWGANTRVVKIGGARCESQPSGGVICRWPAKPWAVGVTRFHVFVWRNGTAFYVHSNQ